MDFAFFESLSVEEAHIFLENYLRVEHQAVEELIAVARADGLNANFSIASIAPVLRWILDQVKTVPREPDETLPSWIRECDSYLQGLIDFDGPSKILVLRASYYLGESFVRHAEVLSWAIGNRKTALQNMPVVTGFQYKKELPPILIIENLFRKILARGAPYEKIEQSIDVWLSNIYRQKEKCSMI